MGDVLRTTPLLAAYRRRYPDAQIHWVVDPKCRFVLENHPRIDVLRNYSQDTLDELSKADYDIAINLDKEPEALDTIERARAAIKYGFGWNAARNGVAPLRPSSEFAVRLGIDDELKFRTNRKTYQQISYEQAELAYERDDYDMPLSAEHHAAAERRLKELGLLNARPLIGLNTGSGERFAGKKLPVEHVKELAKRIHSIYGVPVLLLGGPEEAKVNPELAREIGMAAALDAGTNHTIQEFAALVKRLDLVFTGDTIAMHIAIAVRTPAVTYFGSTAAAEIDLYDRGHKVVSELSCAPCYKKVCPIDDKEKCMKLMTPDLLWRHAEPWLKRVPQIRLS